MTKKQIFEQNECVTSSYECECEGVCVCVCVCVCRLMAPLEAYHDQARKPAEDL